MALNIVRIGDGSNERPAAETVGAKAANLAHMAALGLSVPPAFVLPVDQCAAVVNGDHDATQKLSHGLANGIKFLEEVTGQTFGDRRRPLLVSVRSGAARSMPGMLDTVLDVGCTLRAVHGLIRMSGHPRFAWDCRRRFLESYASVVLGLAPTLFADSLTERIAAEAAGSEQRLDSEAVERLAQSYQQLVEDEDAVVADDPMEQLATATRAVYRSWVSERAVTYRRLQGLEDLRGTAVTVQAMVFGNRDLCSGSGVAFSRDPSTGAAAPIVDFLFEAQGEDVVSGRRTPETEAAVGRMLPSAATQLRDTLARLERAFVDVQDVEFTIESGKLWILQTRSAKRTPQAALRFAIDLVEEGLISPAEALKRVAGLNASQLARRRLAGAAEAAAHGTAASAGIAVGRAAFDSASATGLAAGGDPVILVRPDTSTADVTGFAASAGIVTAVGGRTAHAALVARQMGKPCIVGCAALAVNAATRSAKFGAATVNEGDWLSIDGDSGAVYIGKRDIVADEPAADLRQIERWRAEAYAPA